jgi:V/A-type H+-transporting ATPase subunit I
MFSKADIRKVSIGLQRKLYDELIYELGKEELIHLTKQDVEEVPFDTEMEVELNKEGAKVKEIITLTKSLLSALNLESNDSTDSADRAVFQVAYKGDITSDETYLSSVRRKIQQFEKLHSGLLHNIEQTRELFSILEEITSIGIDADVLKGMKLCSFVFGKVRSDFDVDLSDAHDSFIIKQHGGHVIGITLSGKEKEMLEFLERYGFEDETEKINSRALWAASTSHLRRRIHTLKNRLKRIEDCFNRMKDGWITKLSGIHASYLERETIIDAEKMFLFSREAMFLSGWMDKNDTDRLGSVLRRVCGDNFFLVVSTKAERNAPVVLKNNRLFKPFELLVKNAGLPGNTELDPTPFAAITYVLMFGVMFGDVGQGFVLALAGLGMKLIARRRKKKESFIADAGSILQLCGVSAAVFGFFYGSLFSNEHIIPALWFHPMENILSLFFAVIMMGAVFIAVGILLNVINGLLMRDYSDALFGARGLVGLIIYAGLIFLFIRYIETGVYPVTSELIAFIIVPLCIFSMRNILGFFFLGNTQPFPHGVLEYVVETLIEIMEMFSGFLGNTISFIRAGAFALSHAGLSVAIYTLARIINPDITTMAALMVLIVGNIFIILLEGLICGIQSMRLEYYEFFGKFFKGDGYAFTPFSLKKAGL